MPLLWISIAFIAGTVPGLYVSIPFQSTLISGIALFIGAIFEKRLLKNKSFYRSLRSWLPVPLLLIAAAFFMGITRGITGKPAFTPADLAYYNGTSRVIIRGMASQPAENNDKSTMLTISAKDISIDGEIFIPVKGEAVILLPAGIHYSYGDRLAVTGNLETPPERSDFSYKQYLENKGVFSYLSYPRVQQLKGFAGNPILSMIYQWRERIAVTALEIIPQPEAGFLAGMLVGRDESISDDLKKSFKDTGTSHLVAISGFNITILSGLILALTNRLLLRKWSVLAAILLLSAYTMMAGASPSVVRAAIMGALAIIGKSIGRTRTAINSLCLASALMVLFNPLIIRDIGFQLSVAATAGILLIGSPINDWFITRTTKPDLPTETNQFWSGVGESVLVTLGAQLATLPLLLSYFDRYPLISLLVNPLVLPAQPAAMMLGMAATAAGIIFLPAGKIIGMAAWLLLAYTTRVVDLFAAVSDFGLINLHMDWWLAGLTALFLLLAVIFRKFWMKKARAYLYWGVLSILCLLLGILINSYYLRPDGNLHIEVFRQGTDLSALVLSPGGQHLLLTNRPGDKDLIAFVDQRLPLVRKQLDAVILPNPSSTTSTGLSATLSRFPAGMVMVNTSAGGKKVQSKLELEMTGNTIHTLIRGERFDLGRGAIMTIVGATDQSTTCLLTWGNTQYILQFGSSKTGDPSIKGRVDALMIDHAAVDEYLSLEPTIILTSEPVPSANLNRFTVPDGGWLVIESNGQATSLLEKANGSS